MHIDYQLGKILSEDRIREAERIRERRLSSQRSRRQLRQRLGSLLIAGGERLAGNQPSIA